MSDMVETIVATKNRPTAKQGFYYTQLDNVVMFDNSISQTAKVVYCALLNHVKKGTNRCKLYISTIAKEINKSTRTVRRVLTQLCERGIIIRLMQYGSNKNQLASLFIIVGRNAACYRQQAEMVETVETSEESSEASREALSEASSCEALNSVTKTSAQPELSCPPDKSGRQNNKRCKNKSVLKDTLIGQAELPTSSASFEKTSLDEKTYEDKHRQICIDFEAYENDEKDENEENNVCDVKEMKDVITPAELLASKVSTDSRTTSEKSAGQEQFSVQDLSKETKEPKDEKLEPISIELDPLADVTDADKIPNDMRDTTRYFLYRTGRNPRTVNAKEIEAMKKVFQNHYPARIQKEIDIACNRFIKFKRNLKTLFFGYIAKALEAQQSLVPFEKLAKKGLAKKGIDGNITACQGSQGSAQEVQEVSNAQRYLTSDDI